jgi:cytosolic 5'-nucleotidase 3
MKNIVIPDEKSLEQKIKKLRLDGLERLHVVSDFDRTLTKAFFNGEKIPALSSILREEGYFTADYASKSQALFDKYHPLELDLTIPLEKKKKLMQEWWEKVFDLLIQSRLNKKDIEKVVNSGKIRLRGGTKDFFESLHNYNVPLRIISSTVIGEESISMFLSKEKILYDNVHIISNSYEWDKEGRAIAIKKPIIHVFNKDETSVKKFPVFEKIKDRKNIILLGDSIGDIGMVKGFEYEEIIKVGFRNYDEDLEEFKKNYDVIILNDSSMDYVNKLIKKIVKS